MSHMSMDEMIEVLARYRYNAKHDADRIKALEDELSRLRASSFVTAVPAEDYEKMKAENARLKAECQARQAENSVLAVECDSLKAEVERLTKAGDAMADELIQEYGREVCLKFGWFNGWIAAKGVQS